MNRCEFLFDNTGNFHNHILIKCFIFFYLNPNNTYILQEQNIQNALIFLGNGIFRMLLLYSDYCGNYLHRNRQLQGTLRTKYYRNSSNSLHSQ